MKWSRSPGCKNRAMPMKKAMLFIPLLLSIVALAACSKTAHAGKFDARALFQPGMSTMQMARETCAKGPGPEFGACFVRQMQAAGASPQAVVFMHAIDNDGFMRDFRNTGRVDIAFADYPFAANENQHCLLVNGTPNVIDVDDYKLIPQKSLAQNPTYAALLKKFPNLSVFPGNRSGTNFLSATHLKNGGQRFLVPYVLVDGCHACARVGALQLAFEFDRTGKFLGANVASVKPLASSPAQK